MSADETAGVDAVTVPVLKTHTASCVCGQFKIHLSGDPVRVAVCHCYACQQRTGSVFGTQARFLASQITSMEGTSTSFVRIGDSGGEITYKFCPTCGSTLTWSFKGMDDITVIAVGSLCNSAIGSPVFSVYEARKHPWVNIPGEIDHWD